MTTILRPRAIHQFHASSALGDGITNAMLFIQKILRRSGYVSNIYCIHVEPGLSDRIRNFSDHEDYYQDVLLVHYSMGSNLDGWITSLTVRRILIYHNITPAHFFPAGSEFARLSASGRQQLIRWASDGTFVASIADSVFNADELTRLGFPSVVTIGLLVDLERIRAQPWSAAVRRELDGARNLLFVGRIARHKNQLGLVHMMRHLIGLHRAPVRLLLAGATSSDEYLTEIRRTIVSFGLTDHVLILGPRSDADLCAFYRMADLFVSASQHEGFGMSFVEAMAFGLPVLAHEAGSIAATVGPGGLVMKDPPPEHFAAAVSLLLQERGLRRRVIQGQRAALDQFEESSLVESFEQVLCGAGLDVTLTRAAALPQAARLWSVEGPFDSSYSLSLVNRELARALSRAGEEVALTSRDGPGPFEPNAHFVAANADLSRMIERDRFKQMPAVVLRNQFPPHVADLKGNLCVLANYAWEESGFPSSWIAEFNASLDLITVTSAFVAKALRNNGVWVPIAVVGNGVDHIALRRPAPAVESRPSCFRFLHVSSGFPRKGIDALLAAWSKAFTAADPVELVIKLFPNIHNRVAEDLEAFRAANRVAAPITLIDAEIEADAMISLYRTANAVVCPSRGEGFGLPLAEAMMLGIPVVTTAYGGQTDFCTPETAWLCDYRFAYASTHLDVFDSVWTEPSSADLARILRMLYTASSPERALRTEAARARILSQYTWDSVARRTRGAVDKILHSPRGVGLRKPIVGLVSSWNVRCGIAAYADSMVSAIEPERLRVFANRVPEILRPDQGFVSRCWVQDWKDPLDELFKAICDANVDAVVIQFNFGFFNPGSLSNLIERLERSGRPVFVVLHSTQDVIKPEIVFRLTDIYAALATTRRLLVHSVHDLNRLKDIGLVDNVALFPMGLPSPFRGSRTEMRRALGWENQNIIASFGYLLPHKGHRELIAACALMKEERPNLHLLMLNAIYPAAASEAELRACQEEIVRLGLDSDVTLITNYLDESALTAYLAAADIVVYPYQDTNESASAAVRLGLASLSTVAVSPLPIFSDIATVCHTLPGTTPADIANGLLRLMKQSSDDAFRARQEAWVAAHSWPILSARLDGLIRGELDTLLSNVIVTPRAKHDSAQSPRDTGVALAKAEQ